MLGDETATGARSRRPARRGARGGWRARRARERGSGLDQPSAPGTGDHGGPCRVECQQPVTDYRQGDHPAPSVMPAARGVEPTRCLLLPPRLSASGTQQLMQQQRSADRHYSVGHINARSLAPRLNEVCHLVHSESLDVLCISETWLSESVLDAVLLVPGYKMYRCDRPGGRRGGGVAILVSNDLRVSRLHDTSDGDSGVEALWLSVGGAGRTTVVVGAVYRPPGVLSARQRAAVRRQFESALTKGKTVYVLGDFNVNLLTTNSADSRNFNLLLSDFNMVQLVTEPTHPHPVPSLLDLAITSASAENVEVSVLPHLVADHYPIIIKPAAPRLRRPSVTIHSRPWHRVDWNAFSLDILNANWACFYSATDVNYKVSCFMRVWDAVAGEHCPVKSRTVRRPDCPWLRDSAVRDVMRERDAARRAWAVSRSVADRQTYRQLRNQAKLLLTRARRSHLTELLRGDPKRFWARLKQFGADLSSRGSPSAAPPGEARLSADQLNEHFAAVGARVAAEATRAAGQAGVSSAGPRPYKVPASAFVPHCVTLPELSTVIGRLSASGAVGVDDMPISAIRSCLPAIIPHILHLINTSISTLTFPDAWKVAIVTPIHKSGDPDIAGNFRPISILPALSKILEKVVCSQLSSYLINNHILSPFQYAYRPSHSTEDALLDVVEWVARKVDAGDVTSLTSIDLSKAFDSVDHSMLLNKLGWYGISSSWFSSYLSGRSQLLRGGSTAALPLSHGVPQGSIVGPILFLIFVNDLSCFLSHGRLLSYADDTQILDSAPSNSNDLQVLKSRAEENILCLQNWFSLNSLKMNADKTCFILLGTKNSIDRTSEFSLQVNDNNIRPQKQIKMLGVVLDQTLSWESHISSIIRRTNSILVSLYKIRPHLSPEILQILVQTHVFPHLQYCSSVWGGAHNCRMDRLQKCIHFAARLVAGLRRYDHVTPALDALGWPSIGDIVARRDAVNVHRALHVPSAPESLRSMFRPRCAVSERSTRATAAGTAVMELPRFRLSVARRLFPYRAAESWNALPRHVTNSASRSQLVKHFSN